MHVLIFPFQGLIGKLRRKRAEYLSLPLACLALSPPSLLCSHLSAHRKGRDQNELVLEF